MILERSVKNNLIALSGGISGNTHFTLVLGKYDRDEPLPVTREVHDARPTVGRVRAARNAFQSTSHRCTPLVSSSAVAVVSRAPRFIARSVCRCILMS